MLALGRIMVSNAKNVANENVGLGLLCRDMGVVGVK